MVGVPERPTLGECGEHSSQTHGCSGELGGGREPWFCYSKMTGGAVGHTR